MPAVAWWAFGALAAHAEAAPDNPATSPIPPRLVWPGVAVIIVIAIFVTAALAGPLIRANSDETAAPAPPEEHE
jgi:hypothetical protein